MPEPMVRRRPGPKPRPSGQGPLSCLAAQYEQVRRSGGVSKITRQANRYTLRGLIGTTGDVPASQVRRGDVERYVGRPALSPARRRHELSTIRTFWRWLILEGHATADPTIGVTVARPPRQLPRGLRPEQVRAVLEAAPDARARLIVLLMVQEGLRCIEVARLDLADVDLAERTMRVTGKGGHERLLPISDETLAAMTAYLAGRREPGPLIRSLNDPGLGIDNQYLSHLVKGWMQAAGVPESAHALRHTCATDLLKGGVHVRDVQAVLGHSNIAVTSRYLPTNVADLRDVMAGRRYADEVQLPAPERAMPTPVPALDAVGPLIDTVAALAATVARLDERLSAPKGQAAPDPPPPLWRPCPHCSRHQRGADALARHIARDHSPCPACGRVFRSLSAQAVHRRRIHGGAPPYDADCPCPGVRHDHTPAGVCVCPQCVRPIREGATFVARHLQAEHTPCPDCDRSFVDVNAHRRRAHPWSGQ